MIQTHITANWGAGLLIASIVLTWPMLATSAASTTWQAGNALQVSPRGANLPPEATPVNVELSLEGKGVTMQGEPLVLNCVIVGGKKPFGVLLHHDKDDWLDMRLESADGKRAWSYPIIDVRNYPYERYQYNRHGGAAPAEPYARLNLQRVLHPEWLGDPAPGEYRLRIQVRMAYYERPRVPIPAEAIERGVLCKEVVLPLTITRTSAIAMQKKAAELRENLLHRPNTFFDREKAMEIFHALPEEYAGKHRAGMLADRRATPDIVGMSSAEREMREKYQRPEIAARTRAQLLKLREKRIREERETAAGQESNTAASKR